jgi:hypothetical protein
VLFFVSFETGAIEEGSSETDDEELTEEVPQEAKDREAIIASDKNDSFFFIISLLKRSAKFSFFFALIIKARKNSYKGKDNLCTLRNFPDMAELHSDRLISCCC